MRRLFRVDGVGHRSSPASLPYFPAAAHPGGGKSRTQACHPPHAARRLPRRAHASTLHAA
ncbi:Hypothetical protein CAP_8490 [Chondromyces apiculatus DSM 436]|uniref:Uncharacterized protein n=1 Tax=Chondromyces apiculatus DSM 436 TaxID=1192034 RepID=A0A017SWT9_9BACT|nr:Hypothetical protein CAP_8490 [Chondromyces apiculatus DSM 436]